MLWSDINGLCKSKSNGLPKALVTANETTRTKVEMALLLNKHFVQITSKLLQVCIQKEDEYLVPSVQKKYVKSYKKSSEKFLLSVKYM